MKIGNLSLLKLIGKGTMGEVYLSKKEDSKEYYATKKITKEYVDRPQVKKYFINELSILKKLKHNKIVRLIDLKQTPSHYYTNITIRLENNLGEFTAFGATHSK